MDAQLSNQESNTQKASSPEGSRRSRHSAALSLAAISMGATAGVLLANQGDEAKAAEPISPQNSLPVNATGNPYQVLATQQIEIDSEAKQNAVRSATEPLVQDRSLNAGVQALATQPLETSTLQSGKLIANQPYAIPSTAETLLDKRHGKVARKQLDEQLLQSNPAIAALSDVELTQPSITSQQTTDSAEIAATPSLEQASDFNTPTVIPVPQPEVAASPLQEQQLATESAQPIVIPVPTTETPSDSSELDGVTLQPDSQQELPKPQLVVPQAETESVYSVQSGDTIDEIALRFGVSRSDLTRANNLTNPHQIQIAQELKIPQPQSVYPRTNQYETLVTGVTEVAKPEETAQPELIASAEETVVIPTQPVASSETPSSQSVPAQTVFSSASPVIPNEEEQSQEEVAYNSNPYVERLKADIMRMREEYRTQRQATQAQESTHSSQAVAAEPVNANQSVNPEWQTDRSGVLEVQVEDRRQAPTVVAAAPTTPQQYNSVLRTPTGERVSPELPSLSPDQYLPESPARFNGYMWPTTGVVTSGYGRRWGRMHKGIDIAGPTGTPIVAAAPGEVVTAGWNSGGYGNLVDIKHPDGSITRYAHNSRILVSKGQWVEQGERISLMGSTGYSTGPHLHFELRPNGGNATNPMAYLPPK
ncbi:peptidoglycan DD-metalloendopeptidase family protein [Lusitaniella coriacea]|uniref:peptidoglycan DD-metalloendopeptidase family protein n=1 Tax=Lusitaniella coriacea TaxID=1983105 RepID=UPI003CE8DC08